MKASYVKKPIIIEAIQWNGTSKSHKELNDFIGEDLKTSNGHTTKLLIPTLEGIMEASVGDFIIKGIKGEFYPCKPDIFNDSYELVELLNL